MAIRKGEKNSKVEGGAHDYDGDDGGNVHYVKNKGASDRQPKPVNTGKEAREQARTGK